MRESFSINPYLIHTLTLLIAAFALIGIYQLARRLANKQVAVATIICTALYPVFFTESLLAHSDIAVTALTSWGLAFYFPANYPHAKPVENFDETQASLFEGRSRRRIFLCVISFSLAALVKETAILAPLALFAWEIFCYLRDGKSEAASLSGGESQRRLYEAFVLLLPLCVLALRLGYEYQRTGYINGNSEYFGSHAAWMHPVRILKAGAVRLWEVTGHMNLFVLTIAGLLAMTRPALIDEGVERLRIAIAAQVALAFVIAAYVAAFSIKGGELQAREMLPVIPLVMLIWISTLYRRVRRWRVVVGIVCAGFVLASFVNRL